MVKHTSNFTKKKQSGFSKQRGGGSMFSGDNTDRNSLINNFNMICTNIEGITNDITISIENGTFEGKVFIHDDIENINLFNQIRYSDPESFDRYNDIIENEKTIIMTEINSINELVLSLKELNRNEQDVQKLEYNNVILSYRFESLNVFLGEVRYYNVLSWYIKDMKNLLTAFNKQKETIRTMAKTINTLKDKLNNDNKSHEIRLKQAHTYKRENTDNLSNSEPLSNDERVKRRTLRAEAIAKRTQNPGDDTNDESADSNNNEPGSDLLGGRKKKTKSAKYNRRSKKVSKINTKNK